MQRRAVDGNALHVDRLRLRINRDAREFQSRQIDQRFALELDIDIRET